MKHLVAAFALLGAILFVRPLPGDDLTPFISGIGPGTLSNVFQSAPKLSVPLAPSVQSTAQMPIITLKLSTNPPVIFRVPFAGSPAPLAPGIYKTEPFTCLVLVPGPHLDDKFVISGNGGPQIQMPTVQPGLKFIPLKPVPH